MVNFNEIELPESFQDKPYIQLMWRYYYTGQQVLFTAGKRADLRLDDIFIGTSGIITSTLYATENLVQLYPNPTSHLVNIRANTQEVLTATIYGLNGKAIGQSTGFVAQTAIDVSGISPGMYIVMVRDYSGAIRDRQKLLIVRSMKTF